MSKLSDKIREWCDDAYSGRKIRTTKDLYAIADLIDREMVELPKDKDGEPVHVGDKVYLENGQQAEVDRVLIGREEFSIDCHTCDTNKLIISYPTVDSTHTGPDSFERIANELDEMVDGPGPADDVCEMLADTADRIRKLAEEDKR